MKDIKITEFLTGISAVSILIGLALLGLTLGDALSTTGSMADHKLFWPAMVCIGAGVLNLIPMLLVGTGKAKSKNT